MNKIYFACVFILIIACSGPSFIPKRMGQLSVGMTKSDVLKIMERAPNQFKADSTAEYLIYETHWGDYFVRFVDGKVNAYGKTGDFGSPKDPPFFFKYGVTAPLLGPPKQDAYGPRINSDATGRPFQYRTNFDNKPVFGPVVPNGYGLGVHMDQYGRPVHTTPWP